MIDDGCPTCGSKKYGPTESKNNKDSRIQILECQNCKKIWTS